VEITDYMVWKFVGLVVLAFVYSFWKAFKGRK
jgi:hypothetical protein